MSEGRKSERYFDNSNRIESVSNKRRGEKRKRMTGMEREHCLDEWKEERVRGN